MNYMAPPEGLTIPQGMRYCELPAGEEGLEFWGRFLDKVDTDSGDRLRWAELRLYKYLDTNPEHDDSWDLDDGFRGTYGQEIWLLYTVGHSLVYHAADSSCNRGVRSKVSEFPAANADHEDLEPCEQCSPADWETVNPDEEFRLEITWYSYTPCATGEAVVRSLYRPPSCKNCRDKPHEGVRCRSCGCTSYAEAPRMLSIPGRRLIEQVRKIDPDIARSASRIRKL